MRICLRNRISAPAIGAGILALAAVTHVQSAQPVTGPIVAQAATADDARSKAAAKSKAKKPKHDKGTGNGGQSPEPAPAGPPDPGKYL